MRFAVIVSAVAGLLTMGAAAAAPSGPDLWNGALAGASIDQVAAATPQAKPATGQVLEDGSQSGLSAPAQLAGSPAEAIFFFQVKSLSAVLVESRAMKSGRGPENLAEARRIVGLATSQYGPPQRCIDRAELAALNCTWTTGSIKVAVSYHDFGGGSPALSVLYSPAIAPHAVRRSSTRFTSGVR
ncbi:MAG TPA: hypothetical protein VE309_11375 [Caulobacteraceae bacterium]|nr:hypothetical protein [Caulobacteraceae bacterium]